MPNNHNSNKDRSRQGASSQKIEKLGSRETLVVHVVGARAAEIKDVTIWEILPLRLPKLKYLTVVFIGPELRYGNGDSCISIISINNIILFLFDIFYTNGFKQL